MVTSAIARVCWPLSSSDRTVRCAAYQAVAAVAAVAAWPAAGLPRAAVTAFASRVPGPGHSDTLFTRLDGSLSAAITADQAVFRSNAVAGRGAFTGLEIGVIVLALIMAAGCAFGLSKRLAEYR